MHCELGAVLCFGSSSVFQTGKSKAASWSQMIVQCAQVSPFNSLMWEKDNKQEKGQYVIHPPSFFFSVWLDFFSQTVSIAAKEFAEVCLWKHFRQCVLRNILVFYFCSTAWFWQLEFSGTLITQRETQPGGSLSWSDCAVCVRRCRHTELWKYSL